MEKKLRLSLKITEVILYVFASILFFKGFAFFAADIDGFPNQWWDICIEIAYFLPIYWLFVLHLSLYQTDAAKFKKMIRVNGIVFASIALVGIIYTSILLGTGVFFWGNRNFSIIFPGELYIIYALTGLFGGYMIKSSFKEEFQVTPHKYIGSEKLRGLARFLRSFYVLLSMYFFGGFLVSLIGGNFNASSAPYFVIYIIMVFNSLVLLYYEFIAHNDGEFKCNPSKKMNLIVTVVYLTLAIVLYGTAYSLLGYNSSYIIENFQMLLPLDFMGSLFLFLYLITLPGLGYSIYFFIRALKQN